MNPFGCRSNAPCLTSTFVRNKSNIRLPPRFLFLDWCWGWDEREPVPTPIAGSPHRHRPRAGAPHREQLQDGDRVTAPECVPKPSRNRAMVPTPRHLWEPHFSPRVLKSGRVWTTAELRLQSGPAPARRGAARGDREALGFPGTGPTPGPAPRAPGRRSRRAAAAPGASVC